MNRKTAAGSLVAFALLTAIVQPSCTMGECNDCGDCGFVGGPNQEDSIGQYEVGADPGGVPAVELVRYEKGECGADGGHAFWLRFENGAISVEPAPDPGALDHEAATQGATGGGSSTYTFEGSGVTVTIEMTPEGRHVSFINGATSAAVMCTLDGEDAIACTPDPA